MFSRLKQYKEQKQNTIKFYKQLAISNNNNNKFIQILQISQKYIYKYQGQKKKIDNYLQTLNCYFLQYKQSTNSNINGCDPSFKNSLQNYCNVQHINTQTQVAGAKFGMQDAQCNMQAFFSIADSAQKLQNNA
eukprot:TRINITY_DN4005_c0_g1_i12.p3 TRINITY_DN4005_c0_g1~~TRINITY_DN4005_c0_g1_i12.p3  ORF type:complete len:133 (+),score=2.23 TRINITY_DN4005_c0_g1_i12:169-567(+)